MENMHPYRVDFIYSELSQDFNINSVMADIVERDGIFEIERFMKDLGSLYNAVRFYVALENRQREESRPEGIMICCRHCGKFLIRRSNRQEFCDSEECQRARNARKQMAYRKRKAGNDSEKKRRQRKTKG